MKRDVLLGQYIPGQSFLHRMDPRYKLLVTVGFVIVVFLGQYWQAYLAMLAFVAMAITASKLPLKFVLRAIKPLWMILVFTFVLNVFFTPGKDILLNIKGIKITQTGITTAVMMSMRLVVLVMGTSLMTLTTSPIDLTDAMERLMTPLKTIKFPAHELSMMMSIALRFIPTLMEETDRIMKAQMARGADFESGNLLQRAKALLPLLVPLFVAAFRRAEDLALAMEARCYQGGEGRTRMKSFHTTWRDPFAFVMLGVLTVFMVIW